LAVTALVLGIVAVLSCWTVLGGVLFGLLGLIFGIIAVVKARRGTAVGGAMAIVGIVLALLGLVGAVAIGAVAGNWVMNHGGRDYQTCVRQANNDQAKIQRCADDFKSSLQNAPAPTS
jgi:thiol:disulfide interchange protein